MSSDSVNNAEDTEMAECDGDKVVTMMEVLQEQQEFEEDANAVLGASDDKNCTYPKGYIKRQALYACLTCCSEAKVDPTKRAGVCLACSLTCHENHELVELYTKRNFRCDCGNPKFNSHPCQFTPDKTDLNEDNVYNQNFSGLYCTCHRPYPDPESTVDDDMIQCIICEDWLHASHLDAVVPANDQYSEMICKLCMEKNEFLHDYSLFAVNNETGDVDVITVNGDSKSSNSLCNGDSEKEALVNGIEDRPESTDVTVNGDVEMSNVDDKSKETDTITESTVPENSEEMGHNESSKVESVGSKPEDTDKPGNEENKMELDVDESKNESLIEKDTETSQQDKIDESSTKEDNTEEESAQSEEKRDEIDTEPKEPEQDTGSTEDKVDETKIPEETDAALKEQTETQESSDQITSETGGDGDHVTESGDKQNESAKDEISSDNTEQTEPKESEQEPKEEKSDNKPDSESPEENITVPDTSQSEQAESENVDKNTNSVIDKVEEQIEKENADDKTDAVTDTSNEQENVNDKQDSINEQPEHENVTDNANSAKENVAKDDVDDKSDSVMDAIDELLSGDNEKESEESKEDKDITSENTDNKETKDNEVEMNSESKNADEVPDNSEQTTDVDMSDNSNQNDTAISENKPEDEPKLDNTITEANDNAAIPDTSEPAEESKIDETENVHKTNKIDSTDVSEPVTHDNKLTNGNQETPKEHKRKLSTEQTEDISTKKAKFECVRPKGVKRIFKGATFWPSNFRQKLCTCGECISMYNDLKVLFLTDPEDTVSAYESLGKENVAGCASQYEKGLQALSSLDRIQQINALTEYNKMRDKLLDFLKSFKDRKEIVKEEDIKAFFAGMKPRREPDGVYFCR